MKIAVDCRMIGMSGIGTYIEELVPRFVEHHSCLLIGNAETLSLYNGKPNTEICECNIKIFSLKEMFSFPKDILAKINSCDAYYTPYCNVPNGITVPIFSTIHDVVFLDINGLSSRLGTMMRKIIYQRAINKSKAVFTVSKFSESRIKKNLQCRRTVIVSYSAVPSWLKKPAANTSSAIDACDKQKDDYILFVGNIKKHKGLSILLDAFLQARENGLKSTLVIVGDSENFRTGDNSIKSQIDQMPEGSVRFTGKISNKELRHFYQSAKLLVQPSLYEGFGLPPLEAMTLGTNALISDIEVFQEIYKEYPVHFFESGNADDLAKKIVEYEELPSPENVPEIYSFDRTYGIVSAGISFYR